MKIDVVMDHMPPKDRDFSVDLESGGTFYEEVGSTDAASGAEAAHTVTNLCSVFVSVDEPINGENGASLSLSLSGNKSNGSGVALEQVLIEKKSEGEEAADLVEKKERRKPTSAKKPPRPPRHSKSLSMDEADQKLIKEIAEQVMLKRERIERAKALKKLKVEKSSPSIGNLCAMIFTVLFCLVIISQV